MQELAVLDSSQAQQFAEMQFEIQQRSYEASYPAAENKIIQLADQPIGRILVERSAQDILLVDIALLPDHRRHGIGSALIEDLMYEAAASQKPLRLSVYETNRALRLYERLGFSRTGQDSLYISMQWTPGERFDESSQLLNLIKE